MFVCRYKWLKTAGLGMPHLSPQIHPSSWLGKPSHWDYIEGCLACCFLLGFGTGGHGKKTGRQLEKDTAPARRPSLRSAILRA